MRFLEVTSVLGVSYRAGMGGKLAATVPASAVQLHTTYVLLYINAHWRRRTYVRTFCCYRIEGSVAGIHMMSFTVDDGRQNYWAPQFIQYRCVMVMM
jgi:hypothetical protein